MIVNFKDILNPSHYLKHNIFFIFYLYINLFNKYLLGVHEISSLLLYSRNNTLNKV